MGHVLRGKVGDTVVTVWAEFVDEAAFRAFHDAACADLGIPFHGTNAATGEPDPYAQWTTAYVDPVLDLPDGGTIKALVRDEDVDTYRLTPAKTEPVFPDIDDPVNAAGAPVPPDWDWHQPIPPEYQPAPAP